MPSTWCAAYSRLSSVVLPRRGSARSNTRSRRPQTRCSRSVMGKRPTRLHRVFRAFEGAYVFGQRVLHQHLALALAFGLRGRQASA